MQIEKIFQRYKNKLFLNCLDAKMSRLRSRICEHNENQKYLAVKQKQSQNDERNALLYTRRAIFIVLSDIMLKKHSCHSVSLLQ